MIALSTFTLASALENAIAKLPEKHFIAGKGRNARRISTRLKPDGVPTDWREVKTQSAAKAHVTRETNRALSK